MKRLLIIGGSDAGISAALRAREVAPDWTVTMVVADAFPNFSICGLPFFLSGETPRWESLAHRPREDIEAHGIRLLLDTIAESIDSAGHRVSVRSATGRDALEYDRLVICTGAVPVRPPVQGLDQPGVYQLHSMADSFAVHTHLEKRPPRRAVIVGGGYIGLEMADALRHRGVDTTLCEHAPNVLRTVDPELGARVGSELERNGVQVRTSTGVERIERTATGLAVHGTAGLTIEADLALVVTGVRAQVALGQTCGVPVGALGALEVDQRMASIVPDVFAAGDCVHTHHRLLSQPGYLPLGTTAHKQGRVAGGNAVGGSAEFDGTLGTQVVKVFGLVVGRTGLRTAEAAQEGFEPVTIRSTTWDHKSYYPGATELIVRVTADRRTRRLLGAQLLGAYGAEVSKRLDVFATALFHRMTVDQIPSLDLSYTPPLSSPWDPVQMSCMALARELDSHPRPAEQEGVVR
jgi:NADPH-dependent 2,4-dienoyl-CoA reductase/sulfur reductase-like enzyme